MDCVATRGPVLVADLANPNEVRWPAYGPAMLDHKIRGVFAIPVVLAGELRRRPGPFPHASRRTTRLTSWPALSSPPSWPASPCWTSWHSDLQAAVNDPYSSAWAEFNALSRTEVSQATGMLVAQLGVEPAEALVRLRAHAYATNRSATDVARDILDRRLQLDAD